MSKMKQGACRTCLTLCATAVSPQKTCLSVPKVFTVSLVWPTADASRSELRPVLATVSQPLDLSLLFNFGVRAARASLRFAAC